jgi:cation diffusion facilitator family transporter
MDNKIKFGLVALGVIIFQSILKLTGVFLTGSLSFLSETVDTIVDIAFVSILLYSLKRSQKPPDFDHMYGHLKFDPIGAMIQGIVLINLYVILIINAFQSYMTETYNVANADIGLVILIISFLINFIFSRVLISQGRKRKSLALEMQGLNLFQDSLRAVIVFVSFIFALFGIIFLDPILSIILSIWIIIGAIKITKEGIQDLSDINPVSPQTLEELRTNIFNLDHVNAVHQLKIRSSGELLFVEVQISVEDHLSVVHANEVTRSIRSMTKQYIPGYNVESIIEMNPLGGETSVGEHLINLIHSMQSEFPEIIDFKDLNIITVGEKYSISIIIMVDETLTLTAAHKVCSEFGYELREQAPVLSRIITHIEGQPISHSSPKELASCESISSERLEEIKNEVESILRKHEHVKGFHALEFWAAINYCILELHVFFDGFLNISQVHEYITELEHEIRVLEIKSLKEVILHSEPVEDQKEGIIF